MSTPIHLHGHPPRLHRRVDRTRLCSCMHVGERKQDAGPTAAVAAHADPASGRGAGSAMTRQVQWAVAGEAVWPRGTAVGTVGPGCMRALGASVSTMALMVFVEVFALGMQLPPGRKSFWIGGLLHAFWHVWAPICMGLSATRCAIVYGMPSIHELSQVEFGYGAGRACSRPAIPSHLPGPLLS